MGDSNQPKTVANQVGGNLARTSHLERRFDQPRTAPLEPLKFSYSGAITAAESPADFVDVATVITRVRVSILTAAVGNNVVEVHVDGVSAGAFTLTAGDTTSNTDCAIVAFPGQPITVVSTSVSGSDLSVHLSRRPR